MDITTHFLVPYAGALWALGAWRRDASPRSIALALTFGVAGFSPDLDGPLDPVAGAWPSLFFLQHRGVSHALIGAPVFGLFTLAILVLCRRRWPSRFVPFAWDWGMVLAAVLGSWTHLVLDGITYGGVPALWPFAYGRWMWPVFPWIVATLFPIGLLTVVLHPWRRLPVTRKAVAIIGASFVVALLVSGAVTLALRPAVPDDGMVLPRSSPFQWMTVTPVQVGSESGWDVALVDHGTAVAHQVWTVDVPDAALDAVAQARGTSAYKGFRLGLFGPEVVRANATAEGWDISFTAVVQRFDALHGARWTPSSPREDWGLEAFTVARDGRVTETHRGW